MTMRLHDKLKAAPGRRMAAGLLRLGVILALSATLGACKTQRESSVENWLVVDPAARHPILVGSAPVTLDLAVPRGSSGLNRDQMYELRHFLRQYQEKREGPLLVGAPSGGANEIAVMHAMGQMRREFTRAGISRGDVRFDAYSGGGAGSAPIKVSYHSFAAHGPECGDWSDNLGRDSKNVPYRNFGCATQRNLAAMIANPRDLIEPRGMTPRDSQRRDVIMDKYIRGETTIAKKGKEEKVKVSEISGGGEN